MVTGSVRIGREAFPDDPFSCHRAANPPKMDYEEFSPSRYTGRLINPRPGMDARKDVDHAGVPV